MAIQPPTLTRTGALIAALTLLVAALMLCLDGTRDGDLYLQLASGRFIAQHGFSAIDPFQTIAHDQPWLNQQWLTELVVYRVARWIGVTGLSVAYAALIAAPLALLLWLCRRKSFVMMIALAALYCPGLWVIVHPRAAGFTVLGFSTVIAILATTWTDPHAAPSRRRLTGAIAAMVALFALWANLHGGFLAGLILIAVVVAGLVLDHRRGAGGRASPWRIVLLALTGVMAFVVVILATPLGPAIWAYLMSFRNPAISLISSEWRPALTSPLAMVYVCLAAGFAAALWWKAGASRPLTPALVTVAFLLASLMSIRNVVFVGPALALMIAHVAPDRSHRIPLGLIGLAVGCAAIALLTWTLAVGPARNEPILDSRLIGYALRHPPNRGHIATYAGVGSYMLWRSPRAPVELDGWLEHFSENELRGTYALLDGRATDPVRNAQRLRIGAVIADRAKAIRVLRSHGFSVLFKDRAGAYLTKGLVGAQISGLANGARTFGVQSPRSPAVRRAFRLDTAIPMPRGRDENVLTRLRSRALPPPRAGVDRSSLLGCSSSFIAAGKALTEAAMRHRYMSAEALLRAGIPSPGAWWVSPTISPISS